MVWARDERQHARARTASNADASVGHCDEQQPKRKNIGQKLTPTELGLLFLHSAGFKAPLRGRRTAAAAAAAGWRKRRVINPWREALKGNFTDSSKYLQSSMSEM